MNIRVYFTINEVDPALLPGSTVVVIDVVRATTTITEALANGARGIYPTASTEEAVKLASSLGRDETLLCGERKGAKVEGFDLGNSPREFTREAVEHKRLVMSTTNGTRAFVVGGEGDRLFACAFTNLGAVARHVAQDESLVVLCAGREDQFSIDDALCAGHLVQRVVGLADEDAGLNDGARAALALAGSLAPDAAFLAETEGGQALVEIGLDGDFELCAQVDKHDIVPEMRDQAITLSSE